MNWRTVETRGNKTLWSDVDEKRRMYYKVTYNQDNGDPDPPRCDGGYYDSNSAVKWYGEWNDRLKNPSFDVSSRNRN